MTAQPASQAGLVLAEVKTEEKIFRIERRRANATAGEKDVYRIDLYSTDADEALKLAETVVFGWTWLDTIKDEVVTEDSVSYKCVREVAEKDAIKPKRVQSTTATVDETSKKDK